MKLYRVILKGMISRPIGISYGCSYVVAEDPTTAYNKLKEFLDKEDIGFTSQRELDKIELIADENKFTHCETMLFL